MRAVERSEILDYVTYGERRQEILEAVLAQKKPRRIHLSDHLTFLFENHDTVRFQIQEMVRVEQLVKEADIQHEIDTYNELLGAKGELGVTLLIEIDDVAQRRELLRRWKDLPRHIYVKLEDGQKIYARFDPRQVGEDRLSSVQYLKFDTRGTVPVAVGSDHELVIAEAELTEEQRAALETDLL
ncbi:MAG TPA: DUF3501 family protein [Vicinamibacteria bacterium]|nr:DUF3501 family protein [Vicinamibacteria bacterium]